MDENKQKEILKTKLQIYGIFSIVAILAPIIFALVTCLPDGETRASWFQRSGSIIVIASIWIEFRLFSIRGYFALTNSEYIVPFDLPDRYNTSYKIITGFVTLIIIFGTLIWGYGEIFLNTFI